MKYSVISADIIASTNLSNHDKDLLNTNLKKMIDTLQDKYNIYGRLIKGDYIECVVPEPKLAFRVALILKCLIKSIKYRNESEYKKDNRSRMFLMHGLRIVISYGELKRFDKEKGIIDGDAIYKSGRLINQFSTSDTERVTIKNTIFFISDNNELTNKVQNILFLIDFILGKTTTRQSEILLMKLL